MLWRVAKSFGVSVTVLVGLIIFSDLSTGLRNLWASIAFLVALFYLRFRDDWYGRP